MDSLTQAALGATIGEALFGRKLGSRAALIGAFFGALPDFDIIAGLVSPWASLVHHRGITHSLFFATTAAPLLGWAAWRVAKKHGSPYDWTKLAFLAVVTHPILDICTNYGTQFLAPFSDRRLAIDAIPIVDPIYTLPLLASLILALLFRRVRAVGGIAASAALAFTTAYLGLGYLNSQHAQQLAHDQLAKEGFNVVHMRAQPSMLVWLWRVVARDDQGNMRVGFVSTYEPTRFRFEHVTQQYHPLAETALATRHGRLVTWFADDMVRVRVEEQESGTTVYLDDMRYGLISTPTDAFWGAVAKFDETGALQGIDWVQNPPRHMPQELPKMWQALTEGVDGERARQARR